MKIKSLFLTFAFGMSTMITAIAGHKYDNGVQSKLTSMGNGEYLEVHQSQNNHESLWLDVIKKQPDGSYKRIQNTEYDTGISPKVTRLTNGVAVEVHDSQNDNTSWIDVLQKQPNGKYRRVQNTKILNYDGGSDNIASVGPESVLMVHADMALNTHLAYALVQRQSNGKFKAVKQGVYDHGMFPSIAPAGNGKFLEVHQSQYNSGLWADILQQEQDGSFKKIATKRYDTGYFPMITAMGKGIYLEVHQSDHDGTIYSYPPQRLFYNVLKIENGKIVKIGAARQYDEGAYPSVAAIDSKSALEVHGFIKDNCGNNFGLYYKTIKIPSKR